MSHNATPHKIYDRITHPTETKAHHGDGLEEGLEGVLGVLPRQEQQPLVPDRLQGLHLLPARASERVWDL